MEMGINNPYPKKGAYSSAGEHFVDIEGVTGSIPVTPTTDFPRFFRLIQLFKIVFGDVCGDVIIF